MSRLIQFKAGDTTAITKNFKRSEFQCKCGCADQKIDETLVNKLQIIRTLYDTPITVTSGYRCASHNAAVGGTANSKHTLGIAADVKAAKLNPVALGIIASSICKGVGIYWYDGAAFVHVDARDGKATWLCTAAGKYNYTSAEPFILPTVKKGSRGAIKKSAIMMLQRLLGLTVDGKFGDKTEQAVKEAQAKHGLTVDGIVGEATWKAISGVPE